MALIFFSFQFLLQVYLNNTKSPVKCYNRSNALYRSETWGLSKEGENTWKVLKCVLKKKIGLKRLYKSKWIMFLTERQTGYETA